MDKENLTVIQNEIEPCRVNLDIEVAADEVKKLYDATVGEFYRAVRIPGFRPGKAPKALVQRKYAKDISKELKNRLLSDALETAISSEDIAAETNPSVDNRDELEVKPGSPFFFSATLDVAPSFELPEYKGLTVEVPAQEITDERVEQTIEEVLQRQAQYEQVDRPAEEGDLLKVTYHGVLQGEDESEDDLPETTKFILDAENTWLPLRDPELLPGSREALLGAEAGTEKSYTAEFPEEFFEKALIGKTVEYTVTVHEVHASQVPELDDDLAKQQFGAEDADEARERVRQHLENQEQQQRQQAVRQQVIDKLLEGLDFPVPPAVLASETFDIFRSLFERQQRMSQMGQGEVQTQEQLMDSARQMAQDRLKQRYLLAKVAKKEDINVSREEIARALAGMGSSYGVKPEILGRRLARSGRINDLVDQIMEHKTMERLLELVEVKEAAAS